MKIVVAADSFKGSMRSDEAGSIIADGIRESLGDAEIKVIPVADGGEGTTDAVIRATGGEIKEVAVTGPLGDPATAHYGLLPDGQTAIMEMASASGIELVPTDRLDPMKATTYGTGELMRAAVKQGCARSSSESVAVRLSMVAPGWPRRWVIGCSRPTDPSAGGAEKPSRQLRRSRPMAFSRPSPSVGSESPAMSPIHC